MKCKHYLWFGSFKYGEACKFDHPPEEKGTEVERPPEERRPGEVKCKHYLRFGSCKYGEACKFDHPPEEKGTEVERPPEERYEVAHV